MNFTSAVRQLRNSQCAKTPSMRGYVKREDYAKGTSPYSSGSALFPVFAADHTGGYASGDRVWHDGDAWVFITSHAQGSAWDENEVLKVTSVFDLTFVENGQYQDTGSTAYQDGTRMYAFRAVATSDGTEYVSNPSSPLAMDSWLLTLMLRDNWDVFALEAVESSASSTRRW